MDKFKVGDRVRYVGAYMAPRGAVGTVRGLSSHANHTQVVFDLPEVQGSPAPWNLADRNLELVTPSPAELPAPSRILPDDATREQYPLYDGLLAYFPAALAEIARWSKVGNDKHNPGEPLHWAREKSTDHENKIVRHLIDAREVNKEGFVEAVAMCWRALALCQEILEERGWAEGPNARRSGSQP